jgi:hypothetical protein
MLEVRETCVLCGKEDFTKTLGAWFENYARWIVHLECWLAAYDLGRHRKHSA